MAKRTTAAEQIAQRLTTGALNSLITEMVEGEYPDNGVVLGFLIKGNRRVQVQLVVIQDQSQFMEWLG